MGATVALVVALHLLALPQVFVPVPLRADSDTAVMLDALRDAGGLRGTWRWLTGDWFLQNGFYRPTTCLSLVLDYTLYGERAWGYRLTNWLLMLVTALGLLVALRAFARQVGFAHADALACLSALMLSLQQTGLTALFKGWSGWWFVASLMLAYPLAHALSPAGGVRHFATSPFRHFATSPFRHFAIRHSLFPIGAMLWGVHRLMDVEYERLIGWVPSRTALLMTALGVWSLYCLLVGAEQRRWGWLLAGFGLYLLALGAYEQAIMLTPLFIGLAIWRRKVWGRMSGVASIGVLAAACLIVCLRLTLLPLEPSRYQEQQLRSSLSGPLWHYFSELIPPIGDWNYWRAALPEPSLWLFKEPWDHLVMLLAYIGVLVALVRWREVIGAALLWQALTFLPMTFLHPFEHYYYLPQLGKTAMDVGLLLWGFTRFQSPSARHRFPPPESPPIHPHPHPPQSAAPKP
ncbi:MAG: hypothetical protein NZL85_06170 [Fimbriimonadales bacterium]|nr:hypothetical protein [Fimbriimonadales bacterium]